MTTAPPPINLYLPHLWDGPRLEHGNVNFESKRYFMFFPGLKRLLNTQTLRVCLTFTPVSNKFETRVSRVMMAKRVGVIVRSLNVKRLSIVVTVSSDVFSTGIQCGSHAAALGRREALLCMP